MSSAGKAYPLDTEWSEDLIEALEQNPLLKPLIDDQVFLSEFAAFLPSQQARLVQAINLADASLEMVAAGTSMATVRLQERDKPTTYDQAPDSRKRFFIGGETVSRSGSNIKQWTCSIHDGSPCEHMIALAIVYPAAFAE